MRDLLFAAVFAALVVPALRHPIVAVCTFVVIGIATPHRLTWGFAHDFNWAMAWAPILTLSVLARHGRSLGEALANQRRMLLFLAWSVATTAFALDPEVSARRLLEVLKLEFGVVLAVMALREAAHVRALVATVALSLGLLGLKSFAYLLVNPDTKGIGGPIDSPLHDNNNYAVALILAVPLLYWLAHESTGRRARWALWIVIVACVAVALATYSRGGLLALAAMSAALAWRSQRRAAIALLFVPLVAIALAAMPSAYWDRIATISEWRADASALSRVMTWETALDVAGDRLTGAGYDGYLARGFRAWIPPDLPPGVSIRAAHSVYFQVLNDHGWPGLLLFLSVMAGAFRALHRASRAASGPEAGLARALQVSLIGYAVGGAFLSLAYFETVWYLFALAGVVAHRLMRTADAAVSKPAPSMPLGRRRSALPPRHAARTAPPSHHAPAAAPPHRLG